ncbi:and other transporter-domain-containing protein [Microdochium bolleyi]|uniref:And other transporter-domain-containing protein n=1 Tax=Microdochium bolleyi TaxID=196109 RepID=A0A136IXY6_9PEZI|nr:and other transporter-domain-containing protein [Microdochium bolleyi]
MANQSTSARRPPRIAAVPYQIPGANATFELPARRTSSAAVRPQVYDSQAQHRAHSQLVVIENPLSHYTDDGLVADVLDFAQKYLHAVDPKELIRAARVAKDVRAYDEVARSADATIGQSLPVHLTPDEKLALMAERDSLFSQKSMLSVFLSVTLAAFLQGFVQSSINGASLYSTYFIHGTSDASETGRASWILGAVNAAPFLAAAFIGCWMSLPSNDLLGRKGSMAFAAVLIMLSSIASAWCSSWEALLAARIVNGIAGMGIKAVSTPILASETVIGYWRGTFILAWQLWVAFGIFIGFVFNLIFRTADAPLAPMLILGAPFVPSLLLLASLWFCPESPRWYLRQNSRRFNPSKALQILYKLRATRLQALRDIYLIYKSIQKEESSNTGDLGHTSPSIPRGIKGHVQAYLRQYRDLFAKRRLRNALFSSSTVAIAQQLCGINVFAFYSGNLFLGVERSKDPLVPMLYSLGFGAVNFVFGLPAVRTIDTLGRRKWLIITLPMMGVFMMSAAIATTMGDGSPKGGIVAFFVFLFTAAYSPGLGPIPFTLASESFPTSHREAGCSSAIATNLFFAGILSIVFPSMHQALGEGRALGLFSGLCFVAFVLVFLLVEETKRRSLESLDQVFAVPKSKFVRFQVQQQLPWFVRRYVLRRKDLKKPSLYMDLIWGREHTSAAASTATHDGQTEVDEPVVQPKATAGTTRHVEHSSRQRPASVASNDSAHE